MVGRARKDQGCTSRRLHEYLIQKASAKPCEQSTPLLLVMVLVFTSWGRRSSSFVARTPSTGKCPKIRPCQKSTIYSGPFWLGVLSRMWGRKLRGLQSLRISTYVSNRPAHHFMASPCDTTRAGSPPGCMLGSTTPFTYCTCSTAQHSTALICMRQI